MSRYRTALEDYLSSLADYDAAERADLSSKLQDIQNTKEIGSTALKVQAAAGDFDPTASDIPNGVRGADIPQLMERVRNIRYLQANSDLTRAYKDEESGLTAQYAEGLQQRAREAQRLQHLSITGLTGLLDKAPKNDEYRTTIVEGPDGPRQVIRALQPGEHEQIRVQELADMLNIPADVVDRQLQDERDDADARAYQQESRAYTREQRTALREDRAFNRQERSDRAKEHDITAIAQWGDDAVKLGLVRSGQDVIDTGLKQFKKRQEDEAYTEKLRGEHAAEQKYVESQRKERDILQDVELGATYGSRANDLGIGDPNSVGRKLGLLMFDAKQQLAEAKDKKVAGKELLSQLMQHPAVKEGIESGQLTQETVTKAIALTGEVARMQAKALRENGIDIGVGLSRFDPTPREDAALRRGMEQLGSVIGAAPTSDTSPAAPRGNLDSFLRGVRGFGSGVGGAASQLDEYLQSASQRQQQADAEREAATAEFYKKHFPSLYNYFGKR